jgi:protein-tyrosine phosphatase
MIFTLLSASLTFLAVGIGGWAWLLLWPAASGVILALGYAGLGARVLGKRPDGGLAWWAVVLHLPYLALTWVLWHVYRLLLNRTPCQQVAPGLWLGRRPLPGELPEGVSLIVDMTAEFRKTPALLTHHQYVCLPTLDTAVPTEATFLALIDRVAAHEGAVYVHCAAGHGRAATVAAAVLLRRGLAADVREAERLLRRVRPGVRLQRTQRALLARLFHKPAASAGATERLP